MPRFRHTVALRLFSLAASATALATLTGCGAFTGSAVPTANALSLPSGNVHGGQQAVVGAQVSIFAMSATGYKTASTNLIGGAGFVLTDTNGGFTFSGLGLTCPAGDPQIYFLARGGNPGQTLGTNNTALEMISALGPCSTVSGSTFANINEVSTIAAATALQPFMADGTDIGTSSTNLKGLNSAVAAIQNMTSLSAGSARSTTPAGNGVVPAAEINTLANILAPCVNSTGPTSPACTSLFAAATPSGGSAPTTTLGAALNIAAAPTRNVATLFSLPTPASPFQPSLSSAPNDFSIGITYSPTGGTTLSTPGLLVIDANGNVFSASCTSCVTSGSTDSIVEFSNTGSFVGSFSNVGLHATSGLAFDKNGNLWSANIGNANGSTRPDEVVLMTAPSYALAPNFPFQSASLGMPQGVAVDTNNNAWVASPASTNSAIVEIAPSGLETGNSPYTDQTTGANGTVGIAFDNAGFLWAADYQDSTILKLSSTGALVSNMGGYPAAGLASPIGVSLDASGNVWTINDGTNSVSELNSTGAPINGSPYTNRGLFQAAVIAIDGAGSAWIANCRSGCPGSGSHGANVPAADNVIHLSPTGDSANTTEGFQNAGFNGVGTTAIDASGNVWVSNSVSGTITQLVGVAAPVKTPLALASSTASLGVRP